MYRSHGGMVWRAVLAMSAGSREVADEATCEAFARLYAYRTGVRDPVAWVFRTAFRLAARELKHQHLFISDAAVPETIGGEVSLLPAAVARGLRRLSGRQVASCPATIARRRRPGPFTAVAAVHGQIIRHRHLSRSQITC